MSKKIFSAFFFAFTSVIITFTNKIVLTSFKFPSFLVLGYGQLVFTILIILLFHFLGFIKLTNKFGCNIIFKIFPLPIFYLGNLATGLGGTGALSLPMFTVLRRLTNVFLLFGEYIFLRKSSSLSVKLSIGIIILGAGIAAVNDLAFDLTGYLLVFGNNIFTASFSLTTKSKLVKSELDRYELLLYNSIVAFPAMTLWIVVSGDLSSVSNITVWSDWRVCSLFIASSVLGCVLLYSTILCTQYNTPLTTSIVGVMKNTLVTYAGMLVGGDYVFSWPNFIGLTVSAVGAILYTWSVFIRSTEEVPVITSEQFTPPQHTSLKINQL